METVKCDAEYALADEISLYEALGINTHWKWCVYNYQSGSWDGSGYLVACDNQDMLYECSLGHCSCYGPGDGGVSPLMPLKDYLSSEQVLDSIGYGIDAKIHEICAHL